MADIIGVEVVTELVKQLFAVSSKVYKCRGIAKRLANMIDGIKPTIEEIQYSGIELSPHRQTQLRMFSETLEKCAKLTDKVLKSSRWNMVRQIQHHNKMVGLEQTISTFLHGQVLLHVLANVHHARAQTEVRLDQIDTKVDYLLDSMNEISMKIRGSQSMQEALKTTEATMDMDMVTDDDLGNLGVGLDLGKMKVKEMMFDLEDEVRLIGISGMSGSGKTTLAKELARDEDVRGHFGDKVLFLTVSQSPNLEELRSIIWGFLTGSESGSGATLGQTRKLVILDDVWTRESLDQLMFPVILGTTTLVVSQSKLAAPWNTFDVELLNENEATSHESRVLAQIEETIKALDPKTRECFLDLGSFPADKNIPLDVLINMFVEMHDLGDADAVAVILDLENKNLLTLVKDSRFGAMYTSYYETFVKQHGVVRDVALRLSNRGKVNKRERLLMPKREKSLPIEWERSNDEPFNARVVSIHTEEMNEMDWFDMDLPKAEVLIINFSSDKFVLPPFVAKMGRLRALVIINNGASIARLHDFSFFTSLAKLRSLWLEKVHVPELTSSTVPLRNLHKLSLIMCKINNSFYQKAVDIAQIFPNLSDLTTDHCNDLVEIPSNICGITSLYSISITNCPRIKELPKNLSKLKALQLLRLYACPELEYLPVAICELPRLKYLDISQCVSLSSLPEEIGKLRTLEKLDMRGCDISNLPSSAVSLTSLRHVICDEKTLWVWEAVEKAVPGLRVEAAEKSYIVDWLDEGSQSMQEALKTTEATMDMDMVTDDDLGNLGVGLDLGKMKVKEMMFNLKAEVRLIGISGMSGSGKTTLAKELARDEDVRGHFGDKVLFLTVSQSPNLEELRSIIWGFLTGSESGSGATLGQTRKLVILDDVWTRESLDQLTFPVILGTTTLVVSQSKLAAPWNTFDVELLSENEATSHESRVLAQIEETIKALDPKTRECFLDLGSFPADKNIPLDVLINMFVEMHDLGDADAVAVILDLENKNLLTLVKDSRFGAMYTSYYETFVKQHDVVRDVALRLSNRGKVNKRERLLMPNREKSLPKEWESSNDEPFNARVVSIHTEEMNEMDWFDMDLPKAEVLIINFSSDKFVLPPFVAKMGRLRALMIINNGASIARLHDFSIFTNLAKLRSLWLEKVHVPELTSSTVPLRNLHKLSLIMCKINNSFYQKALDIAQIFPNLSDLTIDHCNDLVEIPSTICGITSLYSISITNCPRIKELPKNLGKLKALQLLRLYACPELEYLPVAICELPRLKYLDISQCVSLSSLPEEIGKLRTLEKLDMRGCEYQTHQALQFH